MAQESESTKQIDAAMVKAQAAFKPIKKTRKAKIVGQKGSYEYKYADLADVLNAVTKPLNDNGIFQTQRTRIEWTDTGHANLIICTELRHESGEKIVSEWPLALQQQPQQSGILLSYYRRYALCAVLGIQTEEMESQVEADESGTTQGSKPVSRRTKNSGQIPSNSGKTKTELQAWLKEFVSDIHACSTVEELHALVHSSDDMISAVQKDLSNWWYGDSRNPDYEPVAGRLARIEAELTEAEFNAEAIPKGL